MNAMSGGNLQVMDRSIQRQRHAGIELGRLLAAFFVVYIHTGANGTLGVLLDPVSSFAVPFFAVVSGYFFYKNAKIDDASVVGLVDFLFRLFKIYFIWILIYSIVPAGWLVGLKNHNIIAGSQDTIALSLAKLINTPLNFFFDGPPQGFHLWFLPSLFSAGLLLWLCIRVKSIAVLWLSSVTLFVIGLLGGSFQNTTFGFSVDFNMRNGPFFIYLLFAIGWQIRYLRRTPDFLCGLSLMVVGCLLSWIEKLFLVRYEVPDPHVAGYFMSSGMLGVGIFVMLLNLSRFRGDDICVKFGSLSLGVYLLHVLLRTPIYSVFHKLPFHVPKFASCISLFIISFIVVFVASKVKAFRQLW